MRKELEIKFKKLMKERNERYVQKQALTLCAVASIAFACVVISLLALLLAGTIVDWFIHSPYHNNKTCNETTYMIRVECERADERTGAGAQSAYLPTTYSRNHRCSQCAHQICACVSSSNISHAAHSYIFFSIFVLFFMHIILIIEDFPSFSFCVVRDEGNGQRQQN